MTWFGPQGPIRCNTARVHDEVDFQTSAAVVHLAHGVVPPRWLGSEIGLAVVGIVEVVVFCFCFTGFREREVDALVALSAGRPVPVAFCSMLIRRMCGGVRDVTVTTRAGSQKDMPRPYGSGVSKWRQMLSQDGHRAQPKRPAYAPGGHDSSLVYTLAFSVMSVHAAVGGLFPPIGC